MLDSLKGGEPSESFDVNGLSNKCIGINASRHVVLFRKNFYEEERSYFVV